jgi:hypothetical protein
MARPSDYNLEIAAEICERLAGGEPLQAICRKGDGMPTDTIVRRWRYALPEFCAMCAHAREDAGHAWAERAVAMAMTADPLTAVSVRVKFDALRWYASKLAPKTYGDKLQHIGDRDNPVATSLTVTYKRPGEVS